MKNISQLVVIFLAVTFVTTTTIAQTLYKSVGRDGKVVYSDSPPTEGRIEKTMTFENLPRSALPAAASSNLEQLRKMKSSSPTAAPISGVVLYTAVWCGYCRQAKAYLGSQGISYREIDIDTASGMSAFAQSGGGGGVPLLLAGGQRVQGFSLGAYDAVFANRK